MTTLPSKEFSGEDEISLGRKHASDKAADLIFPLHHLPECSGHLDPARHSFLRPRPALGSFRGHAGGA